MTEDRQRAAIMLWHAVGFGMAADAIYGQMEDTGNTMLYPAFVSTLSFSLELHLKTVYLLRAKRTPPKFHNVYKIYMEIPKKTRPALNRVHKMVNGKDAVKLPTLIETVSDHYNTFRYLHEAFTVPRTVYTLSGIEKDLLNAIDAVFSFVGEYEHDVYQRFRVIKSKFLPNDGDSV